jgi:hypothetical protein
MGHLQMLKVAAEIDLEDYKNGNKKDIGAFALMLMALAPPEAVRLRHYIADYNADLRFQANDKIVMSDEERAAKEKKIMQKNALEKYKAFILFMEKNPNDDQILKSYGYDIPVV